MINKNKFCLNFSDGSKWKTRRRLITPTFHFQILNNFIPVFEEQASIMVTLWSLAPIDKFNLSLSYSLFPRIYFSLQNSFAVCGIFNCAGFFPCFCFCFVLVSVCLFVCLFLFVRAELTVVLST